MEFRGNFILYATLCKVPRVRQVTTSNVNMMLIPFSLSSTCYCNFDIFVPPFVRENEIMYVHSNAIF